MKRKENAKSVNVGGIKTIMTDDPHPGEVPETEEELFNQILNDERI